MIKDPSFLLNIYFYLILPHDTLLKDDGMTCLFTNRQSQNQIKFVFNVYMTGRLDDDKDIASLRKWNYLTIAQLSKDAF